MEREGEKQARRVERKNKLIRMGKSGEMKKGEATQRQRGVLARGKD